MTRLDMVGRAVGQLGRDGFLPTKRFLSFGAAVAALEEAVRERHEVEQEYFSAVTPNSALDLHWLIRLLLSFVGGYLDVTTSSLFSRIIRRTCDYPPRPSEGALGRQARQVV